MGPGADVDPVGSASGDLVRLDQDVADASGHADAVPPAGGDPVSPHDVAGAVLDADAVRGRAPEQLTVVQVENVVTDRVPGRPREWQVVRVERGDTGKAAVVVDDVPIGEVVGGRLEDDPVAADVFEHR